MGLAPTQVVLDTVGVALDGLGVLRSARRCSSQDWASSRSSATAVPVSEVVPDGSWTSGGVLAWVMGPSVPTGDDGVADARSRMERVMEAMSGALRYLD